MIGLKQCEGVVYDFLEVSVKHFITIIGSYNTSVVTIQYHIRAIVNIARYIISVNAKQKWTQYRSHRNTTFYSIPS